MSTMTALTDEQVIYSIKDWRRGQRLSQQELAERLGVSHFSISRWERNETRPTSQIVIRRLKELMSQ
jgi:DNA-binding transcriptional regulator YiaG